MKNFSYLLLLICATRLQLGERKDNTAAKCGIRVKIHRYQPSWSGHILADSQRRQRNTNTKICKTVSISENYFCLIL